MFTLPKITNTEEMIAFISSRTEPWKGAGEPCLDRIDFPAILRPLNRYDDGVKPIHDELTPLLYEAINRLIELYEQCGINRESIIAKLCHPIETFGDSGSCALGISKIGHQCNGIGRGSSDSSIESLIQLLLHEFIHSLGKISFISNNNSYQHIRAGFGRSGFDPKTNKGRQFFKALEEYVPKSAQFEYLAKHQSFSPTVTVNWTTEPECSDTALQKDLVTLSHRIFELIPYEDCGVPQGFIQSQIYFLSRIKWIKENGNKFITPYFCYYAKNGIPHVAGSYNTLVSALEYIAPKLYPEESKEIAISKMRIEARKAHFEGDLSDISKRIVKNIAPELLWLLMWIPPYGFSIFHGGNRASKLLGLFCAAAYLPDPERAAGYKILKKYAESVKNSVISESFMHALGVYN